MTSPLKPWESNNLQNSGILRSSSPNPAIPNVSYRNVPAIPPRPQQIGGQNLTTSNYSPYSSCGYGGSPYRSSMYGNYNGYSNYNNYGNYGMYGVGGMGGLGAMGGMGGYPSFGVRDDAESRFIQYAEESSRHTFSNVESLVRAVSGIAMMLDNTFFAMTSSFRAVLSVAENFGRLRSMFAHIWNAVSVFRIYNWIYRRLMRLLGVPIQETSANLAWKEAHNLSDDAVGGGSGGSSWPTLAFLGILMSAPYFISKLLPKYEDRHNPDNWKLPGIKAKAAFDFVAGSSNELNLQVNDEILLAPTYIQEEMKLTNSGWALAFCNGRSGIVPLSYLVVMKKVNPNPKIPVPRSNDGKTYKSGKRVSFGENQIFESDNIRLENISSINPPSSNNAFVTEENTIQDNISSPVNIDNNSVVETIKGESIPNLTDVKIETNISSEVAAPN